MSSSRKIIPSPYPSLGCSPAVLLVDDNAVNLMVMSKVVQKMGVPYHQAVNGQEAVDLYRQTCHSVQCILIDLSMPVMDGETAIRHIREFECQNGLPRTRIAALTVLHPRVPGAMKELLRALDAGADDIMCKPVSIQNIVEFVTPKGPFVGAPLSPLGASQAPVRRLQMVRGHFRCPL